MKGCGSWAPTSCSEIEVSTSNSKGVSHEYAYDQPASSEHDRHDGPPDGGPKTQKDYIRSCKRFTAFLGRSPETATADDIRRFQLELAESALSIFNRNSIVSGVKFLFRVTLRRLDLVAEFYPVRKPVTIPPVLSADEVEQLLTAAERGEGGSG
jgi:integrase